MSENVETTEVVLSDAEKAQFEMLRPMFEGLKAVTDSANEQAVKIRTATSGKEDALATVLNTSEDADIVAFRAKYAAGEAARKKIEEQLAELKTAISKHAETLLPGVADGFNIEEERKDFMSKRRDATVMGGATLVLLQNNEALKKKAYDYFGITEVTSLGRNGSTSGAGAKRPRISSATINGEKFEDSKGNVTFTSLSAHIGAEVNDLRTAYLKAAGTENTEELKGKEVSFVFQVKDKSLNLVLTGSEGNVAKPEAPETPETEVVAETA